MALDLHKPVSTRLGQLLTQSGFSSNKLMWHFKRGRDDTQLSRKEALLSAWQWQLRLVANQIVERE